ncbi:MAG TPA: hypothetical protein PK339_04235 [Flavitalea sp.]|nr:hypothetical protein [Flavitalea sp.]
MKNLLFILFSFPISLLHSQVFDGAVGWGANWTFPSNYEVYVVKNLNDSGAGSLRHGLESDIAQDARIIVFNGLSGLITAQSSFKLMNSKPIYVAGQTSQHGVLLRGVRDKEFALVTTPGPNIPNGVIFRSIALAIGPGQLVNETVPHGGAGNPGSGDGSGNTSGDNLLLTRGTNMIFDHVSFMWSTDENMDCWGSNISHVTFQNILSAQGLEYATHAYATDSASGSYFGTHSMGGLFGSGADKLSFYNVVFAHNGQRNPQIQPAENGEYEIVNALRYNMRSFGFVMSSSGGSNAKVNAINHYDIAGANSSTQRYPLTIAGNSRLYVRNAISWKRPDSSLPEWDAVGHPGSRENYYTTQAPTAWQSTDPYDFPLKGVPTIPHEILEANLTAPGGVGTIQRNAAEEYVINTIKNKNGTIINWPDEVGGYPTIPAGAIIADSDNDGIPDSLEPTWGNDTFGYINSIMSRE